MADMDLPPKSTEAPPSRRLARILIDCNPFYLLSAATLLYGIYRLSLEKVFNSDLSQLAFSFASLEAYQILLAGTAVFLAARKVWYDSSLLVGLESIFVLIPFMLLSHAVFLGSNAAAVLALTAVAVALAVYGWLYKGLPRPGLHPRLLAIGFLALLFNVALPVVFRWGLESDNEAWAGRNLYAWTLALPALLLMANLLPRSSAPLSPMFRAWQPLFFSGMWTIGTAIHLWSVAYVDDQSLKLFWLAPLAWVASWTLMNRASDLGVRDDSGMRRGLICLPMVTPALSLGGASNLYLGLTLGNILLYWLAARRFSTPRLARECALMAAVSLIAGTPEDIGLKLSPHFTRDSATAGMLLALGFIQSMRSRKPGLSLVAAGLGGCLMGVVSPGNLAASLGLNMAAAIFMIHSLRWDYGTDPAARNARWVVAVIWGIAAFMAAEPGNQSMHDATLISGTLALSAAAVRRLLTRTSCDVTVASAGLFVAVAPFARDLAGHAQRLSGAVVAVVMAFALFALGTLAATMRSKKS